MNYASMPKYRIIVHHENGQQTVSRAGFVSYEKAERFAEKHVAKKKGYNVQAYWD